ncbi:P-loop containing nucleoside triphosphate hydrolase protein [Zychaea mexicana]|uniref:P-loop containing nucleoside triphosphate hydrolase protein n=1 Tax=Zychaea mexicana TaxID=64656 RepID=UPI0022FF1A97|nr:P-loop containing nucleoside triphosphate hydrolase protein [Zychaea mexicana]KAI9493761.1 P-loop containing nucleoside triphosphate hydrolase protein [Zychaea mexicana]
MAPLEVIGAAYSRTGTDSLRTALNMLGYKTHHMRAMFEGNGHPELFAQAYDNPEKPADWDRMYEGWEAAVDCPTVCFIRPLIAAYPDAKVILIERDADSWYDSVKNSIYKLSTVDEEEYDDYGRCLQRMTKKIWMDGVFENGEFIANPDAVKAKYKAHNAWVKEYVPQERLLTLNLNEGIGWEKICEFLGKPVPDEPYPRINSTTQLNEELPQLIDQLKPQ